MRFWLGNSLQSLADEFPFVDFFGRGEDLAEGGFFEGHFGGEFGGDFEKGGLEGGAAVEGYG